MFEFARHRVVAPDRRTWVVQLVWWPRSRQLDLQLVAARDWRAGSMGVLVAAAALGVKWLLWPLIGATRIALGGSWPIEAYPADGFGKGAAWTMRGLRAGARAAGQIADGIAAGNRTPAPAGAVPTTFHRRPRQPQVELGLDLRLLHRWLRVLAGVGFAGIVGLVTLMVLHRHRHRPQPNPRAAQVVALAFLQDIGRSDLGAASRLLYPGVSLDQGTIGDVRREIAGRTLRPRASLDAVSHLAINFAAGVTGVRPPARSRPFSFRVGRNTVGVVVAPYGRAWRVWTYHG